jgi:hypothetical protein
MILALAGLAWYADYDYNGSFDVERAKECFAMACNANYDDIALCEAVEHADGTELSVTRPLLYNDPLLGLADANIKGIPHVAEYYRGVSAAMKQKKADLGIFAPAYETILALSELLENKADFGLRLNAAYDADDRGTLAALAAECDTVAQKLRALSAAHKKSWMIYNKPFGWAVNDLRYGTLIARFETAKERLAAYLDGSLAHIEELEAPRLRFDGRPDTAPAFDGMVLWYRYTTYPTANNLM